MFIVNVIIGSVAIPFLFKTAESAKTAYEKIHACPTAEVAITDDYGQTASLRIGAISARILEDCNQSKMGVIARSLHQQRTQVDFQRAAESDPAIRGGIQRPPMLTPFSPINGRG